MVNSTAKARKRFDTIMLRVPELLNLYHSIELAYTGLHFDAAQVVREARPYDRLPIAIYIANDLDLIGLDPRQLLRDARSEK